MFSVMNYLTTVEVLRSHAVRQGTQRTGSFEGKKTSSDISNKTLAGMREKTEDCEAVGTNLKNNFPPGHN